MPANQIVKPAVKKALDMATKARMRRAKDLGFDVDNIYYHGTNRSFDSFDANAKGMFSSSDTDGVITLTPFYDVANDYAKAGSKNTITHKTAAEGVNYDEYLALKKASEDAYSEYNSLFKSAMDARGDDQKVLRKLADDAYKKQRKLAKQLAPMEVQFRSTDGANVVPVYVKGKIKTINAEGMSHDAAFMRKEQALAKKEGYAGIKFQGMSDSTYYDPMGFSSDTTQIFDPKNIRSVNAAFDPAEKESSKLLASVGAGGVGVGLLSAGNEAQAMEPNAKQRAILERAQKRINPQTGLNPKQQEIINRAQARLTPPEPITDFPKAGVQTVRGLRGRAKGYLDQLREYGFQLQSGQLQQSQFQPNQLAEIQEAMQSESGNSVEIRKQVPLFQGDVSQLREIGAAPELNQFSGSAIKSSLAANLIFDDMELAKSLKQQIPGITFSRDMGSNIIAELPSGQYYLNEPGISGQDIAKVGMRAATELPAVGKSLIGNAAKLMGLESGLQGVEAGLGGDFNPEDVALAGAIPTAIGGVVKGGQFAAKKIPQLINRLGNRNRLIDPQTNLPTPGFQRALARRDMDFGAILDDVDNLPVIRNATSEDDVVDQILEHQLRNNSRNNSLVRYRLQGNNVVEDDLGNRALRLGFEGGQIRPLQIANDPTRRRMREMLNLKRRIQSNDSIAVQNRQLDIVGNEVNGRLDFVRRNARDLREQLDRIAETQWRGPANRLGHTGSRLKDLDINTNQISDSFYDGLRNLGVRYPIDESGRPLLPPGNISELNRWLDFTQSQISEDKSAQGLIKATLRILAKDGPIDAYRAHILKRQMDTMIDFKRTASGLTNAGQAFAKQVRASINNSIRDVSPQYARINDDLSRALTVLDDFNDVMPKRIDLFSNGADSAVGQEMRVLLTNYNKRVPLRNAVNEVNETARYFGGRFDVNLDDLVTFHNTLDDNFGATAKGSAQGVGESAIKAASRGTQGVKDHIIDRAAERFEELRGINDTERFNILHRILNR